MPSIQDFDFSDVRGNETAVLACARAVASGRTLVLTGPPGTGKTMIARRVVTIMDPLTEHERTWLDAEYTGVEMQPRGGVVARPFRAPHHTISTAALIGGKVTGRTPYHPGEPYAACPLCVKAKRDHAHPWHMLPPGVTRAGELQLARYGVLMLDEIHEFAPVAIDALGRAMWGMPGRPLIVATATDCPCGWRGSEHRSCSCTPGQIDRHTARVVRNVEALVNPLGKSEPIRVSVDSVSLHELRGTEPSKWTSARLRAEVEYWRNNYSLA